MMIVLGLILYVIAGLITFVIVFAMTGCNRDEWFGENKANAISIILTWPVTLIAGLLTLIIGILSKLAYLAEIIRKILDKFI